MHSGSDSVVPSANSDGLSVVCQALCWVWDVRMGNRIVSRVPPATLILKTREEGAFSFSNKTEMIAVLY